MAAHAFQHLGGGDDHLALVDGGLDHLFLEHRHLVGGDLHPQVAPGHHHAVGGVGDGVQVIHALPVLNFGDDADVLAAETVQHGADLRHVGGAADKGGGHKVEVVLHREAQVLLVLVGEGGQGDGHAGDIDALVVGQGAAGDHPAADVLAVDVLHLQVHQAVVDEHVASALELLVEVGVGDGHLPGVPLHLPGGEGKRVAVAELDAAAGKGADADLGALGVQNGGHGPAQAVPHPLEPGEQGAVGLVGAVGEVEAGGVHAGQDQLLDDLLAVGGGAKGADNFCFSHAVFLQS